MPGKKVFISGNEAVALGVCLARPHVIAAYPITPQTVVVERLSQMYEEDLLKAEFLYVESEHSALSAMIGASALGARTFTATSSQGLLYMAECLHYASGGRFPILMMNANRTVALPWNIYGDQSDSLALLDSGWIQVYVEDAQEALDMVIQGYKIAEHPKVLAPIMINLDGFVLTHTFEPVLLPVQDDVDRFLPSFSTVNKMDLDSPKNLGFSATPADFMEFKYLQHRALVNAKQIVGDVDREYYDLFGRAYGGLIDTYRTTDADAVLITVGSITGTARVAVDELRSQGYKVGLIKLRYLRPFPEAELIEAVKDNQNIGVIEKDLSCGFEGTVFTNVSAALLRSGKKCIAKNFVAGLGGRSVLKKDIHDIFIKLINPDFVANSATVNFVSMGVDIYE